MAVVRKFCKIFLDFQICNFLKKEIKYYPLSILLSTKFKISSFFQSVNVEHNNINKIPFGIFAKAGQLSKLNFKENELSAFPLDFGTWITLTELNMSNNDIQELPPGFF